MQRLWTRRIVRDVRSDGGASSGQFSFARREDGTVIISYGAAPVTALRGRAADRFIERIGTRDDDAAQRLMERAARPAARARRAGA